MTNTTPNYWFPAKRYGWGWGIPTTWQGWVVLVLYSALMLGGSLMLLPRSGPIAFIFYTFALTAVLIGICYLKGEPPAWRWGKD